MILIDLLIAAVVVAGAIIGWHRGIVSQAGAIIAVVAGIAAARMFGGMVSAAIGGDSVTDTIAGYLIAFIAAYLAVWLLARVLKRTAGALCLGVADHAAGAAFKVLQWGLLLSLGLNLVLMVSGDDARLREPSKPWRSATVSLAPAVLGYLNDLANKDASHDVNTTEHPDKK